MKAKVEGASWREGAAQGEENLAYLTDSEGDGSRQDDGVQIRCAVLVRERSSERARKAES